MRPPTGMIRSNPLLVTRPISRHYHPVDCPLVPPRATRMHPIASHRQPLCPSVRIADRLPITRIVLITTAEMYRPILIVMAAAAKYHSSVSQKIIGFLLFFITSRYDINACI